MVKLIIDNIGIEVTPGTKVIEAAYKAGIVIPHFCYHPALGSVGACRLCAVKVLEGPAPVMGIQMSCMLPVQDGMVVSTTDPEAARMRSLVIEWLMLNHPHDCPVCDEGGECLLQDYTVAGGHGHRRYKGQKRTHVNQYLGPYVEHEMNRCIQCYRCVRFYQDYAGGDDLGVLGRAGLVYFGRKDAGRLESPFSGNLVDICPTGVFTDKTARFRARYWDYQMAPSVCACCSLGCNTIPVGFHRELLKIMARKNEEINGWFICDRGRFSKDPANAPDRPRHPRIEGRPVGWDEAMASLTSRLVEIAENGEEGSIALVGSPRMSLEAGLLLGRLREMLPAAVLCYFAELAEEEAAATAVSLLKGRLAWSMADVARADCIAVTNCDLLAEGPMMAMAIRQAWRAGAVVFLVGECPAEGLQALSVTFARVATLAEVVFSGYRKPVVVCGTAEPDIQAIKNCAEQAAGLTYLLSGPNTYGAALLARECHAMALSQVLAAGKVKTVVAFEADISATALPKGVELLATADWLPGHAAVRARIFLPVTAYVEMDGTFINNEGRAQRFRQVMRPGLPIRELSDAKHPPRIFRHDAPGGDLRPSWRIIADLIARLGGEPGTEPFTGRWEMLKDLDPEGPGLKPTEW